MYIGLHIKYLLFLSDFNETNFLDRFLTNSKISNFMELHPVGAKLFHEDGHMDRLRDMTNLSLFAILQMHLKSRFILPSLLKHATKYSTHRPAYGNLGQQSYQYACCLGFFFFSLQSLNDGLCALYGPSIPHIPLASMHHTDIRYLNSILDSSRNINPNTTVAATTNVSLPLSTLNRKEVYYLFNLQC